jgi:hypothetical protein
MKATPSASKYAADASTQQQQGCIRAFDMAHVQALEDLGDVKHELKAFFTAKLEEVKELVKADFMAKLEEQKADFAVKIKEQEAQPGICQYIGVTLITIIALFEGERL